MLSKVLVAAVAATSVSATDTGSFTAGFDSVTGVFGYLQMKIQPSLMYYSYSLDFTDLESTCDFSQGLTYHIHSYWTDTETSSTTTCADTGGHYDPYLACGPSSQEKDGLCKTLNRTSSQGYTYACSPTAYAAGMHYKCETGDLSGKFGKMMPNADNSRMFQGMFVDPSPPLAVNYNTPDGISNQWISVVMHCPADNSRLACARFQADKC